jgi:hypothetical protein
MVDIPRAATLPLEEGAQRARVCKPLLPLLLKLQSWSNALHWAVPQLSSVSLIISAMKQPFMESISCFSSISVQSLVAPRAKGADILARTSSLSICGRSMGIWGMRRGSSLVLAEPPLLWYEVSGRYLSRSFWLLSLLLATQYLVNFRIISLANPNLAWLQNRVHQTPPTLCQI